MCFRLNRVVREFDAVPNDSHGQGTPLLLPAQQAHPRTATVETTVADVENYRKTVQSQDGTKGPQHPLQTQIHRMSKDMHATPNILDDILQVKLLMIAVATGKARIEDKENEYVERRSTVGSQLSTARIQDPNRFRSLWDWYNYWKAEGLSSYQSRRDYINQIYAPIIEKLDRQWHSPTTAATFSQRHGYAPAMSQPEITIREDAPDDLRRVIIDVALNHGWDYDDLFSLAARIGKKPWELPELYQSGMSSRVQLSRLTEAWPWYVVYDFIEAIARRADWESRDDFAAILNDYFTETGIGWQLDNGQIITRGSEAFETAVHEAVPALDNAGLSTSKEEIHKALADLSHRPHPDLTGAVQHAMAALECTARAISGEQRATLGDIIKHNPGLMPKPLDIAVEKAWGYASEVGRHLQEGREPAREEAELMVGIAATMATYLAKKDFPRTDG
jgi:hypothetical protein